MNLFDLVAGVVLLLTGFLAVQSKNAVHAALALAANFIVMGTVFMRLEARFLGWIEIIVYAGAIMVLFIFVIMLLYDAKADLGVDPLPWLRLWAPGVAALLFLGLAWAFFGFKAPLDAATAKAALFGGTAHALGPVLWRDWLYAVLLVAALLLVATVAAVALVKPEGGEER